MLLEATAASV